MMALNFVRVFLIFTMAESITYYLLEDLIEEYVFEPLTFKNDYPSHNLAVRHNDSIILCYRLPPKFSLKSSEQLIVWFDGTALLLNESLNSNKPFLKKIKNNFHLEFPWRQLPWHSESPRLLDSCLILTAHFKSVPRKFSFELKTFLFKYTILVGPEVAFGGFMNYEVIGRTLSIHDFCYNVTQYKRWNIVWPSNHRKRNDALRCITYHMFNDTDGQSTKIYADVKFKDGKKSKVRFNDLNFGFVNPWKSRCQYISGKWYTEVIRDYNLPFIAYGMDTGTVLPMYTWYLDSTTSNQTWSGYTNYYEKYPGLKNKARIVVLPDILNAPDTLRQLNIYGTNYYFRHYIHKPINDFTVYPIESCPKQSCWFKKKEICSTVTPVEIILLNLHSNNFTIEVTWFLSTTVTAAATKKDESKRYLKLRYRGVDNDLDQEIQKIDSCIARKFRYQISSMEIVELKIDPKRSCKVKVKYIEDGGVCFTPKEAYLDDLFHKNNILSFPIYSLRSQLRYVSRCQRFDCNWTIYKNLSSVNLLGFDVVPPFLFSNPLKAIKEIVFTSQQPLHVQSCYHNCSNERKLQFKLHETLNLSTYFQRIPLQLRMEWKYRSVEEEVDEDKPFAPFLNNCVNVTSTKNYSSPSILPYNYTLRVLDNKCFSSDTLFTLEISFFAYHALYYTEPLIVYNSTEDVAMRGLLTSAIVTQEPEDEFICGNQSCSIDQPITINSTNGSYKPVFVLPPLLSPTLKIMTDIRYHSFINSRSLYKSKEKYAMPKPVIQWSERSIPYLPFKIMPISEYDKYAENKLTAKCNIVEEIENIEDNEIAIHDVKCLMNFSVPLVYRLRCHHGIIPNSALQKTSILFVDITTKKEDIWTAANYCIDFSVSMPFAMFHQNKTVEYLLLRHKLLDPKRNYILVIIIVISLCLIIIIIIIIILIVWKCNRKEETEKKVLRKVSEFNKRVPK